MRSGITGSVRGNRLGSAEAIQSFPVNFNTTSIATGVKLCTVKASVQNPAIVEIQVYVKTAFNAGTTNTVTVGKGASYTDQLSLTGGAGTPGFYPASNNVIKLYFEADTAINAKYAQTGTAATTGASFVIVRLHNINVRSGGAAS